MFFDSMKIHLKTIKKTLFLINKTYEKLYIIATTITASTIPAIKIVTLITKS